MFSHISPTQLERPMVSSLPCPPKSGSLACKIVLTSSLTKRNIQKHSPKSRLKISHRFAQFECRLELVPQRGLSKLKRPFAAGSAAVQVKVPVYRLIYRAFYRVVVSMSKSLLYYLEIEKTLKKKPILCNPALSPQTSRFVLLCRIFF